MALRAFPDYTGRSTGTADTGATAGRADGSVAHSRARKAPNGAT